MKRKTRVFQKMMAGLLSLSCAAAMLPAGQAVAFAGESSRAGEPAAGLFASSAESTSFAEVKVEDASTGEDSIKAYDSSVVEKGLICSHTDKSSEIKTEVRLDPVEDRANLSCDPEIYDAFGFSSDKMLKEVSDYAGSDDYQNPLAGYSFMDPNECLVGSVCSTTANGDDHEVRILTLNNVESGTPQTMPNSIDKVPTSASDISFKEDKGQQTHNGIGFDCDGDGLDEFAYYSLHDGDDYSCAKIEVYRRSSSGDSWENWASNDIKMDEDNYVLDIRANESKGYTALAAGDYDGDGCEEVAFYVPDISNEDDNECADACIVIMKFNKSKSEGTTLRKIYLKDILSDYQYFGDNWYLPTVSLSNSHLRLGEVTEDISVIKYATACDLVINVNVPRHYDEEEGRNLNSATAIYGYAEKGLLFTHEYKVSGKCRMGAVNSCEGDLNGDGFNELIVAGLKEAGLEWEDDDNDASHGRGEYDEKTNYVNLIYYDGKGYKMLWSSPKEIQSPGNLSPNHYDAVEPIALCAGHYDLTTSAQTDQLCVQGVFFSCEGTKISGAASEIEKASDGRTVTYCVIPNTAPYQESTNFSGASFKHLYTFDITMDDGADATNDRWVDTCTSGQFMTASGAECVAIVSSDDYALNDDQIYMDITFVIQDRESEFADPIWKYKTYNDYIDRENEDDNGTSLFVAYINSDQDSFYYRYVDTAASYSAPVLFTVLQVPPYYREANSVATNKFSVKSGFTTTFRQNASLGLSMTTKVAVPVLPEIISIGGSNTFGVDFTFAHSSSHNKTVSHGIWVKSDTDYAVCYCIPLVVNTYEILQDPSKPEEAELFTIEEPMQPVFTALSLADYNAAVERVKKKQQQKFSENPDLKPELPADYTAPILDASILPKSAAGDVHGYEKSLENVKKYSENSRNLVSQSVNLTTSIAKAELVIDQSTTSDFSAGVSYKNSGGFIVSAKFAGAGADVSLNRNFSAGVGVGVTFMDGCSYMVSVNGITLDRMDNVFFAEGDNSYDSTLMDSRILHYGYISADKKKTYDNGIDYQYSMTAALYPLKNIKTDKDFIDSDGNYEDEFHPDDTVQAMSFSAVPNSNPPEGPTKLVLQAVNRTGETDSLGRSDLEITLAWDSRVRNAERKASGYSEGYNIYMTDLNANQPTIHLVNREGLIPRNEDADYMNYTFTLEKGQYNDDCRFYIVPAYTRTQDGVQTVTEGTITARCAVESFRDILNGNVLITEQPVNQRLRVGEETAEAAFAVAAQKKEGISSNISLVWKYLDEGSWADAASEDVKTENDGDTVKSIYTIRVPADQAASLIGRAVKCVLTCGGYTLNSNIAVVLANLTLDAEEVTAQINALPEPQDVTVEDKEKIEAVEMAYEQLSEEEQKKVSSEAVKKLEDVKLALADAENAAAREAFESQIHAEGYSGEYDGEAHGITVSAPANSVVLYGTSEGKCTLSESPAYTKAGSYTVYYEVSKDGFTVTGSAMVVITDTSGKDIRHIEISEKIVELTVGLTCQLTVDPESSAITWRSSRPEVATVSEDGLVTAVRAGSTVISASLPNGVRDTCKVYVKHHYVWECEKNGVYRYTSSTSVRKALIKKGWSAKKVLRAAGRSDTQVYWIYYKALKRYRLTTNRNLAVKAKKAGNKAGRAFYASDRKVQPVYELCLEGKRPTYFYTIKHSAAVAMKKAGWTYKGIAFYSEQKAVS